MTLRFTFLGYEYASIALDIERHQSSSQSSIVDLGIKEMSKLWIKGMLR